MRPPPFEFGDDGADDHAGRIRKDGTLDPSALGLGATSSPAVWNQGASPNTRPATSKPAARDGGSGSGVSGGSGGVGSGGDGRSATDKEAHRLADLKLQRRAMEASGGKAVATVDPMLLKDECVCCPWGGVTSLLWCSPVGVERVCSRLVNHLCVLCGGILSLLLCEPVRERVCCLRAFGVVCAFMRL